LVSAAQRNVDNTALLLGIKTSLSFLLVMMIAGMIRFTKERWSTLIKSLLIMSSAVGAFAVAQVYWLPADFLTRYGYGAETVPAFHLVDPAVSAIRVIATFSGPNQLGSFMIIPLILSVWLVLRRR